MSMQSYRQNVRKGVTGPKTSTCFPAALEQISPRHRLSPSLYKEYDVFAERYNEMDETERAWAVGERVTMASCILESLGATNREQLICRVATRRQRFRESLSKLMATNHRVILDLEIEEIPHAVGVLPTIEYGSYRLVSTWIPQDLRGIVTSDQIFPHLSRGCYIDTPAGLETSDHPLTEYNLLAIPPTKVA